MGCSKKKLCLVDAGQNNKSDAGRCSLVHEHLLWTDLDGFWDKRYGACG